MEQLEFFNLDVLKPVPIERLDILSKEELINFFKLEQSLRMRFEKEVVLLRNEIAELKQERFDLGSINDELREKKFLVEEQYIILKNKLYGKSSERSPSDGDRFSSYKGKRGAKRKRVLLPSLRYPNAPLIEREVVFDEVPSCSVCGHKMTDSLMTENSEYLTVVPRQYVVVREKRHKYRCSHCHGDMKTAPVIPRIKPSSSYSDEMILDVALSKYCDLIPIERYSAMAGREGLSDIPPQSLIELTHYLADFVEPVYKEIKKEVLSAKVLHADETPHRMLEGGGDKSWYLWGFSTPQGSSYFEARDSRSGDVASELLIKSKCEYLISDVYTGYGKAVKETNKEREMREESVIKNCFCNAHARRKFKEASTKFSLEVEPFQELYQKIYRLEKIARARPPNRVLRVRRLMFPIFETMKKMAMENLARFPSKSSIGKAMLYFLKNYNELTMFVTNSQLPIDNNLEERQLRNPVIGRKTWYGNHSKRGAKTSAILFSLVESCKLSGINPREYFKKIVELIHQGKKPPTPRKYRKFSN